MSERHETTVTGSRRVRVSTATYAENGAAWVQVGYAPQNGAWISADDARDLGETLIAIANDPPKPVVQFEVGDILRSRKNGLFYFVQSDHITAIGKHGRPFPSGDYSRADATSEHFEKVTFVEPLADWEKELLGEGAA